MGASFEGMDLVDRELAESLAGAERTLVLVHKRLHFQAVTSFVYKTRVDTGRARGNWQSSIGAPLEGFEQERYDPNGAETVQRNMVALEPLRAFESTWITNNVPYIEFLDKLDDILDRTLTELQSQFNLRT